MATPDNTKKDIVKTALSKVTLLDAGKKIDKGMGCLPMTCESKVSDVRYPCLYLEKEQAPALDGYEVGDTATLVMKVKIIGHNISDSENYKSDEYRVEILKIGKAN